MLGAKELPSAFLCANDSTALMLVAALEETGCRVPRGIFAAGSDDIDRPNSSSAPPSAGEAAWESVHAWSKGVMDEKKTLLIATPPAQDHTERKERNDLKAVRLWSVIVLSCLLIVAGVAGVVAKENVVQLPFFDNIPSFIPFYWQAQHILAQGTIFEGLFGYAPDPKGLGGVKVVPVLAEKWTCSEDGKTWTFTLRKDKKWSNGDPVTARDFEWTYQYVAGPSLPDVPMWASPLQFIENAWGVKSGALPPDELGVKALDDYTLQIKLATPRFDFNCWLVAGAAMPLHRKTVEKYGNDWWKPGNFVGNGPYIPVSWVDRKEAVLVKNKNYVGECGNVDRIILKNFPAGASQVQAYQAGELDLAWIGNVAEYKFVQSNAQLKKAFHETPNDLFWQGYQVSRGFNEVMDNKKLRQAFAMAIDKATIVEKVLRGLAIPANAFTGDQDIASKVTPLEYNPSKARDLLAEAGYADPKSLGTVTIFAPPANSNEMAFVEAVAKMWQENLGVDVTIQNMDWGPYSSLQWSDVNRDIPWGYSTMGGAINFIEPMGLYQNVGHIWWFMEYDPEWNKTRYWYWRDKDNAVDSLTAVGDFAELEDRANAAWNKRLEIVAAENNDWGKSMMVEPTFRQQFDRIAERFRNATTDEERLAAYKNALRLVIGEERSLDNIAHMTETNKKAQRLMASLFLAKMDECDPLLVQLNQLAVDSAWMIPLYIGKITYVVDPKLSGIVQNKLSWGNIFQFQYLNYQK